MRPRSRKTKAFPMLRTLQRRSLTEHDLMCPAHCGPTERGRGPSSSNARATVNAEATGRASEPDQRQAIRREIATRRTGDPRGSRSGTVACKGGGAGKPARRNRPRSSSRKDLGQGRQRPRHVLAQTARGARANTIVSASKPGARKAWSFMTTSDGRPRSSADSFSVLPRTSGSHLCRPDQRCRNARLNPEPCSITGGCRTLEVWTYSRAESPSPPNALSVRKEQSVRDNLTWLVTAAPRPRSPPHVARYLSNPRGLAVQADSRSGR